MAQQEGANGQEMEVTWCSSVETRDGTLAADAKMVNCFIEQTSNGLALVKRAGAVYTQTAHIGVPQGTFVWNGGANYILNNNVYDAVTGNLLSAIPSPPLSGYPFTFFNTELSTISALLQANNGLWTYNSGVITKITDTNYNSLPVQPGIAFLDTVYYVIELGGKVLGSALGDPTVWPALDFVAADPAFGQGVSVCRHLNYILAYYQFGMQVFYDANSAPNGQGIALAPVLSASFRTGCASAATVVEIADTNFFVGLDINSSFNVQMVSGLTLTTISTPFIEKILNNPAINWGYGLGMTSWAMGIKFSGHYFYILTLSDLHISLAYDMVTNKWQVWQSTISGTQQQYFGRFPIQNLPTETLIMDTTTGYVAQIKPTVYTDPTGAIVVTSVSPNYDWNTINWKRFGYMNQLADTANTTVSISFSDNDYQTFSTPRTIDLSTVRKQLRNCGSSRRRAWKLQHSDNTPLRVYSMKVSVTGLPR